MLNTFKKSLFKLYCIYFEKIRFNKGKYRLAQLFKLMFGYARYDVNGIKIELNPISYIDQRLILGEGHDPIVYEMMLEYLKEGGNLLDIGANIGYFSLLGSRISNVSVFAFEPSPRELERFYRNICLNKVSNITVFPYGLSEDNESKTLYLAGDSNPGMNSAVNKATPDAESISCYFATLNSLLPESVIANVQLCKIDVEGFEMSVLKGIANSMCLMKNAKFIVEISRHFLAKSGYQPSDIYNFFEKYGFQPKFGMSDELQYDEVFYKAT